MSHPRERRHIFVFFGERSRFFLRRYMLHLVDLINAAGDPFVIKLHMPDYPVRTLVVKRSSLLHSEVPVLALQDYPCSEEPAFRVEVLGAHAERPDVDIKYATLEVPFWEWIVMHKSELPKGADLSEYVAEVFGVSPLVTKNGDEIDQVLEQITLTDVKDACARYANECSCYDGENEEIIMAWNEMIQLVRRIATAREF